MSPRRVLTSLVIVIALLPSVARITAHTQAALPAAMSSGEIVARGFDDPVGVAVGPSDEIVVSDRKAGTVTEIGTNGHRTVLLRRLEAPAGLTFDNNGGLLIVEGRAGRVLRRDPSGAVGILASGIVKPQWIAVGTDGNVYLSAKRERGAGRRNEEEDNENEGGERILQIAASGVITTFADGFRGLEGLAVSEGTLYAALRRLDSDRGRNDTEVVRFALRPGGSAGPMQVVLRGERYEPVGLAVDRLGAVVASVRSAGRGHERGGVIKQAPPGKFVTLASTLRRPQGVAFEPAGHLLVVEGEPARQLWRFRAPPPPTVTVPPFTNQSPASLSGRTTPGGLVHVSGDQISPALATAAADALTGTFMVSVPIGLNQETRLSFVVSANGGGGLASAPISHHIVHDDHQPTLAVLGPTPGSYTRDAVQLRARSEDDGSGVASITAGWDDDPATTFENTDPTQPIEVAATLRTASLVEGPHTLTVTATDRAGNTAATAQLVTVDRTAPETRIASGPAGEIAETTATFVVEGADLFSPMLEFAWQLDGGGWSAFGVATSVPLTGLTPGEHRFEVKARDLAGNEDSTPAVQTFTVRSLQISILEPADGAIVTGSSAWIRGTVEGGAGEVTVSIALSGNLGNVASPVEGGMFALEVPADPALTMLTVVATDGSGATAQATVSVVFAPDGTEVQSLEMWPPGGLAPLAVRIGVHGFVGVSISIDYEGDGTIDFEGEPASENLYFTYPQAGIYLPTLRLTTPNGQVMTRPGLVEVYDRERLDVRLQAVWTGFKDALRKVDVDSAVSFISEERREAWGEYLRQLPPELLVNADSLFTAITLVQVGAGGAQYEMVAERDGLLFSYAVWFQIDADGRWRLWRF